MNMQSLNVCCGFATPRQGDSKTELFALARPNSTTFEYELIMHLNQRLTCDISTIDVYVSPIHPAPDVSGSKTLTLEHRGCNNLDGKIFSCKFIEFVSSPIGFDYDIHLTYRNASGGVVATYAHANLLRI